MGVALSAIHTYTRQSEVYKWNKGVVEIWTSSYSYLYQDHKTDIWDNYTCACTITEIWNSINKYYNDILYNRVKERLIVCLDMTGVFDEIQNVNILNKRRPSSNQVKEDIPKGFNFEDYLTAAENGEAYPGMVSYQTPKKTVVQEIPSNDDFIDKLKFLLQMGPIKGVHFLFLTESLRSFKSLHIPIERFSHRITFQAPKDDLYEIFGNIKNGSSLENNMFRYSNGINTFSMRLFNWPEISYSADELDGNNGFSDYDNSDDIIIG